MFEAKPRVGDKKGRQGKIQKGGVALAGFLEEEALRSGLKDRHGLERWREQGKASLAREMTSPKTWRGGREG